MGIVIKYLFNASILMLQLATMGYGLWLGVTESWGMGLFMFVVALLLHIPAHRDRPFRLNVTACSGRS